MNDADPFETRSSFRRLSNSTSSFMGGGWVSDLLQPIHDFFSFKKCDKGRGGGTRSAKKV